jgi:heat shock protein HslJ
MILRSGFVVLFLSAAAACADAPATPTSPTGGSGSLALTAEQLTGTWTLSALQEAGRAPQTVPDGAGYTLSFADGGRFSTRADCNTCGGGFTLSGATVTLGPNLACTRAACPTAQFEAAYTNLLSGEATVALSGTTLVLTSPRGALRFSR